MSRGNFAPVESYPPETFATWRRNRLAVYPYFQHVYAALAEELDGAESIIDLAGGDGHSLDILPAQSGSMTVLDADAQALQRLGIRHPEAETVAADMRDMPFDDNSFDAAISMCGFDGLPYDKQMVGEIARILKPGGKFVFMRDMPYSFDDLMDVAFNGEVQDLERAGYYVGFVLNEETGAVDQAAAISQASIETISYIGKDKEFALMALRGIATCLQKIEDTYTQPEIVATLARHNTNLMRAVNRSLGDTDQVIITEPLAPAMRQVNALRLEGSEFEVTSRLVEVDYISTHPLDFREIPIRDLFVDELANPHIKKQAATSVPTRVHGQTRIYIAHKPV